MKQEVYIFSIFLIPVFFSCSKNGIPSTQDGNWITRSQLNGPSRSEATSFVIGNYTYLGTGWDGLNKRYADFWQYDPSQDTWNQVGSLPDSAARSSSVGLTIGNMGYVCTGYDGSNYLKDFWQYNPIANTWNRRADFAGDARYESVGFGIDNYGYVGTGFNGSFALKDFYKYDPSTDSWTYIGFSGNKRYSAVVFLYQNKAYLVTGVNSGTTVNDFWVFDPSLTSENWQELRHITNYSTESYDDGYTDIVRWNASAFVITSTREGDKAFLSTGENGSYITTTWEYDFATDLWSLKSPFQGPPTTGAVGFNVENRGFIATGRSASGQASQSDMLWEFQPDVVLNPNDH
jgi:N-acetylneuraminic acid mutarotase